MPPLVDPGGPVVRRFEADVDLLALHETNPERYPFLLQSTASSAALGRYDILFAFPGKAIELERAGSPAGDGGFLARLDRTWRESRRESRGASLPFTGGWFLYLGYELAAEIEPTLELAADTAMPAALAVRCPAAWIRDHGKGVTVFVSEPGFDVAEGLLESDLSRSRERPATAGANPSAAVREEPPERFVRAVERAKTHIADGDIYQANLSRTWTAAVDPGLTPAAIYRSLAERNPAPFAGLVRWRGTSLVSSSPERLLEIRDGIASTRPIAGTRPRSDDRLTDDSLSAELFANAKERAEHIMLIDLERNDLGRICEPGSVEVNEMMVLESYAHVHHIVSNVRGRLRPGVTPGAAIRAVFPGGTITGVPKVRCMQIIAGLEEGARGAYTGSFGYLNRDGSLDLNILIRTMVVDGSTVTLRAGAGIVADSDPGAELAETRAKAEGLLRALAP